MSVKMPFRMRRAIGGLLMEAHGVGKRDLKEIVVSHAQALQDVRQPIKLVERKVIHAAQMSCAEQHHFKWPDCPERNQDHEVVIPAHDPCSLRQLPSQIIAEQAAPVFCEVVKL